VANLSDLFGNESSGGTRGFEDVAGKMMGPDGPMTNAPQGVPVMLKQAWSFAQGSPMQHIFNALKAKNPALKNLGL